VSAIGVPKTLQESAIILTGGTSGVGLATAKAFVEAGCRRIALIGRDEKRGAAAVLTVRKLAPDAQIEFFSADANVPEHAKRAADSAIKALGGVDVLVNSTAASYVPQLLFMVELEDITKNLLQQASAPMLMSRLVLPHMREQKSGVIINIASDAAKVPTPGETIIGAAMAAIVVFTRTLAIEAKRDGIRANVITPSLISDTTVYERVMSDPFSAKLFGNATKLASLGVAAPEDLAALIVFLAGPQAAKLTGQAISVNGGISAA
jgi:2-hydroxycyclohexanecarboxyl-CoA dehydrogenase